ncbi:MAG: hypothetical protein HUJ58_07110 [Erysipelotrichaceae bacterium]|nr:hypothetical protein [Erysipelotrichaceae bacterium]
MSSIIYNADQEMMEYFRLNGLQTINFWRPSSQTNIRELKKGDYVFFYSWMSVANNMVRGIVGYGKYAASYHMVLDQMWRTFKNQNGCDTKQGLQKFIGKYADSTNHKIHSLLITNVLFFNEPILLKSLSNNISPNIESYVYVDNGEQDVTDEILEQAKEVGINYWAATMNGVYVDETYFDRDLMYAKVCRIQKDIQDYAYNKTEMKRNEAITKLILRDEAILPVSGSNYACVNVTSRFVDLYLPMSIRTKNNAELKMALGELILWKHKLSHLTEDFHIICVIEGANGKELLHWVNDPYIRIVDKEEL